MTKREYAKCEQLLEDAIKHAEEADKICKSGTNDEVELLRLQNLIGYAEGINYTLANIGFKHERMKVLSELL